MSVTVFPDLEGLSVAAADFFVRRAQESIADRGRFTVALAGGNTPRKLYELLASEPYRGYIEWSKVWFFYGDERWVPPTDAASNEKTATEALLSKVDVNPAQVYPMFVPDVSAENGAKLYEVKLQAILGLTCCFDLALLGIGDDGHTASLFPGGPELKEEMRWVVPSISPKGIPQRITLTFPAFKHVDTILFLAAGADKAEPLARALGDNDAVRPPSGIVAANAPRAVWYIDQLAAAQLPSA